MISETILRLRQATYLLPALAAIALAAPACSDDPSTNVGSDVPIGDVEPDVSDEDADEDTSPDAEADTEVDADVAVDTGVDTGVDPGPEEPPTFLLTINELPAAMNGSQPYTDAAGELQPYFWRVNRDDFTIDAWVDPKGGAADWDTLEVNCIDSEDVPLDVGELAAMPSTADDGWRQAFIDGWPEDLAVTCSASITGPFGSASSEVSFLTATLDAARDPFVTVDPWLVTLSRDIFRVVLSDNADGTVGVRSIFEAQGNGVPDFDEAFFALGLMSETNAAAAAAVKNQLIDSIRGETNRIYGLDANGQPTDAGAIPISIVFEGDPGAPSPSDFNGVSFSMIALGGDGQVSDQNMGTFGRALLDWNNQEVEDNTEYGLGVFPAALVRRIVIEPLGALLAKDIMPHLGGTPFGDAPGDELFIGKDDVVIGDLSGTTKNRYEVYSTVMELGGLAVASILTHEIGHSLGLVPIGPPPEGLFSEVPGAGFIAGPSTEAHIDTAGLNVMQTGGTTNWFDVFTSLPELNPLNRAYLRRRLVVGP